MAHDRIVTKSVSRRVVLFVILLNIFAWAGWFVAQDGSQDALDMGNLIWLTTPLVLTILFRLFTRDWKDFGFGLKLRGNLKWYGFSLIFFPLLIATVLLAGKLFHVVSFKLGNGQAFMSAIFTSAGFIFIKNIFEESAWRGYLTPKLEQVKQNRIANHLLVGLIWGVWHIPYYYGLLDSTSLTAYTSLSLSVFVPLIIFSMVIAGIIFGELRLLTQSIWPVVIMHTVSNLVIMTLLLDEYIIIYEPWRVVFTPSWEGVLMLIGILSAGLWLRKLRI